MGFLQPERLGHASPGQRPGFQGGRLPQTQAL